MKRREAIKYTTLLLGGIFSAPTISAINRWERQSKFSESTFSLTEIQRQIVAEVAEMILPKTNTAGAKEADVPMFIEMMMKDCYTKLEHLSFMEGLLALEKDNFLSISIEKRTERLNKMESECSVLMKAREVKQTKMGDNEDKEEMKVVAKGLPFWRLMKELTLLGYFTSEVGIKSSFEYVQIPTKFELTKLKPNQKAYAY